MEQLQLIANIEYRQMLANRMKALADPTRIYLLFFLMQGERSVNELAELTGKGQATVSKHLSILLQQGFLKRRKKGMQTIYSTHGDDLKSICHLMCDSLKNHLKHISEVSSGN